MSKIMVPVDGSKGSEAAIKYAIEQARKAGDVVVSAINVQPSLPGTVSSIVSAKTRKDFHKGEGAKALSKAVAMLNKAGVAHETQIVVGDPASEIAAAVKASRCDSVVMGSRGLGTFGGMVLGSVATKVVSLVDVPVTLVK